MEIEILFCPCPSIHLLRSKPFLYLSGLSKNLLFDAPKKYLRITPEHTQIRKEK